MSNLNKLTAMQNQVFAQMINNPDFVDNFTPALKKSFMKVGMAAVLATATFASSIAHASDNNALRAMVGVSAVSGLLTHNSRVQGMPDGCNIQGVSGIKVGGAMASGAYVGSRFGNGSGKQWATAALGALAGGAALGNEENRVEQAKQDCYRRVTERQAREIQRDMQRNPQYQNSNYQNNNYQNNQYSNNNSNNNSYQQPAYNSNNSYREPSYTQNSQLPVTPLYIYRSNANQSQVIVTMENSAGIGALRGMRDGMVNPYADPQIGRSIQRSLDSLQNSYNSFRAASDEYVRLTQNTSYNNRTARYSSNDYEDRQSAKMIHNNRGNIQKAMNNWNQSFDRWSRERAGFVALIDTAVIVDNIQVSQFNQGLQFITPPQNANIVCNCDISKVAKYSTVPERITMDR
jgi:uncharacterized protein YcfJ